MYTINRTTQNMANKRGITLEVTSIDDRDLLLFWRNGDDCEWACSFEIVGQRLKNFGNIYLPQYFAENWMGAELFQEAELRVFIKRLADVINID